MTIPSNLTPMGTYPPTGERIELSKTNHSWCTWRRSFTPHRLPSVLLGKVATYLPASTFTHLSTTNRAWRAFNSRLVWVALTQREFPFVSRQIHVALQDYPGAIKIGRLYALIYKRLRTTGCYHLQATIPHSNEVYSAVFDPTGSRIVTASGDGAVRVYARQPDGGWVLTATLMGPGYGANSAAFDPTSSLIVTTSSDYAVCVHARQHDGSWALTATLKNYGVWENSAAFDPTGSLIVTAALNGIVCMYARQPNGRWLLTATLRDHKDYAQVNSAAFDPTGSLIVTASSDGTVCVYTRQPDGSWLLTHTLKGRSASVNSAAFDSTSSRIVTASGDGAVCVYTRQPDESWVLTATLRGSRRELNSAAFDSTDSLIVTASNDRTTRIWGLNSHKVIRRAIEGVEIENAGIRTSYQDLPIDVMPFMASFLTQQDQRAHRLVNRISASAYRLPSLSLGSFSTPTRNPLNRKRQRGQS